MGTGSHEEINIKIIGSIPFDYTDTIRDYEKFKNELRYLCSSYNLKIIEYIKENI